MRKKVLSLPSFLMYTLPDGCLIRRGGWGRIFRPLSGPFESLDELRDLPDTVVFKLPDGRYGVYSREVFELGFSFPCPFCRKKIDFDALANYLRSAEGAQVMVKLFERVMMEVLDE